MISALVDTYSFIKKMKVWFFLVSDLRRYFESLGEMVNRSGIDTSVLASCRMLKSLFSFINTSLGLWWRDPVTWMTSLSHLSRPLLRGLILPDGFFNSTTISGGNYSRTVETPMQKGNYIYCCFLARDRICRQGNSWKPIKNWHMSIG